MRLRRIGNRILRRSRISLGNWSFTPKSVPFSSLPRLFTCSFCLKYPNLATIGRGLGAPGFFAPIRWTLSKLSDHGETRCKCPPKRIRDGYKSDRSNHFRRWSGPHSRRNWTSVNGNILTNQIDIRSAKTHEMTRCKQAL